MTYSIVACDLEAAHWGVATQSKFLAVGSVVPWAEPRYLTTRRRRVETCSWTRWSSMITQSATYSSRP